MSNAIIEVKLKKVGIRVWGFSRITVFEGVGKLWHINSISHSICFDCLYVYEFIVCNQPIDQALEKIFKGFKFSALVNCLLAMW